MRTLALGRPRTAFYGSIQHELVHFGEVVFVDERSLPLGALLRRVSDEGFDRVLMPNPYGNETRLACYQALRAAGVTVVASDRGALPDSWFFDHGFNHDSPSYAPRQWDHPITDPTREQNTRDYLRSLRSSGRALEAQGPRHGPQALRARLGLDERPMLFVPLQRPDDTVVRYFSGSVASLSQFVQRVAMLAQEQDAAGQPWNVVFKKHPLETERLPIAGERMRYAPDQTHVHDLLEASDAVLCLNSGVGLLSLCFGKPTGCFGDAFYAHRGLAVSLRSVEDARRFLHARPAPDSVKVERFVHHLRTRVYSFGRMHTELITGRRGAKQRITRHIEFQELRILGEEAPRGDRVVIVSPVIPTGIYRGSQARVSAMIRALLVNGMRVSLAVLNTSLPTRAPGEIAREIRRGFPELERVEVQNHPKFDKSISGRLRRMGARAADHATLGPHRIANFDNCPVAFRRRVRDLCALAKPHFLFVNYAKLTPVVPDDFEGVTVLDTHDYQTRFLCEDQERNRLRRHVNRRLFQLSEHRMLRRFDRLVAINPDEKETFERIVHAPVFFVPAFAIDPPPPVADGRDLDALFVASMSNFNVKGLRWFASEVMPRILERRPGFELTVAGNIVRAKELRAIDLPRIRFLGVVPDLGPLYARSACVVAPLLGGAGMKIKVVEALSYGKAIVATSRALDGIRASSDEHLLRADTPGEFADAVLAVLGSAETRRRLEDGARALHRRDHSFEAARATLARVFQH